jgi:hypothetical protein
MRITTKQFIILFTVCSSPGWFADKLFADELDQLRTSLTFHASFDKTATADWARGDRQVYTAENLSRQKLTRGLPSHVETVPDEGRWGGALRFLDVSERVVLYRGKDNTPYDRQSFEMTVSFWLRVDPENGLKPGYVDPLQITDKKWNDASLFVDFTKDDQPRHFRLGVFSDFAHWNPANTKWEDVAVASRPMVVVTKPPFAGDRWTHVAFSLTNLNSGKSDGIARLYLDGKPHGALDGDHRFTWSVDELAIMLGIQYIGYLDDLAIFDRALQPREILALMALDGGVATLR